MSKPRGPRVRFRWTTHQGPKRQPTWLKYESLRDKLETYIERVTESGCWIWMGGLSTSGYGRLFMKEGDRYIKRQAHRIVYQEFRGEKVPDDLELDHLCRVHCCVNPDHLEPVTHAENMARSGPARQTHCRRGHPLSEDNLYMRRNRKQRECRRCGRDRRAAAQVERSA